ncbi:MAG: ABC transporter ATP-binding protein [Theionarchaea archaeon]|nr:ABC transporter ATP-binding protein [Theionarchaea archaeon]MBU7038192.1 ABC transporter ATP-binding protein [Theionarchaea archaeon]
MKILEVNNLRMYFSTKKGDVKAVEGVSLEIGKGESVGLVGESGCGKTSIGISILKLLPDNGRILEGEILFKGDDLVPKPEDEMRSVRWNGISMIFQAAMNALNPVYKVGDQIVEAIMLHEEVSKEEAYERVAQLYELVGMSPERAENYPHEYSGGMKQRAIIAMALACDPDMIIADEPTTALDVIVQDSIIKEIKKIQAKLDMTMLYISHDISVIAETCERIAVMYAGNVVEYSDSVTLFASPLHPYTNGLLSSFPSIKGPLKKLNPIPGEPPNLLNPPTGCRFHTRCPFAQRLCKEQVPEFREFQERHYAACHFAGELSLR